MRYPNLKEEKKLWKKGFKVVVGLDEAGRGALCGPVVAAAAMVNFKIQNAKCKMKIQNLKLLREIRDSKKLTSQKRKELYRRIVKCPFIKWGIGKVSEKIIDKINILEATKLAMKRAIKNLNCKLQIADLKKGKRGNKMNDRQKYRQPKKIDFLILDGNFKLDLPILQKPIVKGDEKVLSCAMASLIAKVTRDRIMEKYAKKFPKYGFEKHKGYGTKFHLRMLKKYGPCKIHRRSFFPIAKI
jgi:ribonuclease HII